MITNLFFLSFSLIIVVWINIFDFIIHSFILMMEAIMYVASYLLIFAGRPLEIQTLIYRMLLLLISMIFILASYWLMRTSLYWILSQYQILQVNNNILSLSLSLSVFLLVCLSVPISTFLFYPQVHIMVGLSQCIIHYWVALPLVPVLITANSLPQVLLLCR